MDARGIAHAVVLEVVTSGIRIEDCPDDQPHPSALSMGRQLTIAWTVAQPGLTHALVGARTPEQARENAGAADVTLTEEELRAIEEGAARHRPE
jgi:aryl-alcohol dehydrogenase-like predicted oxidoreductase